MTALIVIAAVALVLLLIGLIPVGVDAAWDGALTLAVRAGPLSFRIGGKGDKPADGDGEEKAEKKAGKKRKKKKKPEDGERPKRGLPPTPVLKSIVRRGWRALCRLVASLRVDVLRVHFTSAFGDPYTTAMAYAAAGTAMEGLLRAGGGHIRFSDLRADVDFDADSPVIDGRVRVTIRIFRAVGAALRLGFGVLWDYLRYIREVKRNGKQRDRKHDGRRDG